VLATRGDGLGGKRTVMVYFGVRSGGKRKTQPTYAKGKRTSEGNLSGWDGHQQPRGESNYGLPLRTMRESHSYTGRGKSEAKICAEDTFRGGGKAEGRMPI